MRLSGKQTSINPNDKLMMRSPVWKFNIKSRCQYKQSGNFKRNPILFWRKVINERNYSSGLWAYLTDIVETDWEVFMSSSPKNQLKPNTYCSKIISFKQNQEEIVETTKKNHIVFWRRKIGNIWNEVGRITKFQQLSQKWWKKVDYSRNNW